MSDTPENTPEIDAPTAEEAQAAGENGDQYPDLTDNNDEPADAGHDDDPDNNPDA